MSMLWGEGEEEIGFGVFLPKYLILYCLRNNDKKSSLHVFSTDTAILTLTT